jgi:hypothetical protein
METIELTDFLSDMGVTFQNDTEITDYFYQIESTNNDQPYEYITDVEQRGDGQGYETFFVFKRKSDGKYFSYYIYDGVIEQCTLTECNKEVRTVWDFECKY